MKIFKKIASALMVLPMVAALTACGNEDDYQAPEALTGAQVFFSSELPGSVELKSGETAFDITLNRVNTAGELTVQLSVEQDETNTFNVPESVTFADGEDVALLTVTYDLATIEYDKKYALSLAVSDESLTTPYGNDTYNFIAVLPASWESLGIGLYTDDIVGPLFGASPISYEVEVLAKPSQPGLYRIVYPYGEVFPYNDPGDYDTSKSYDLEINAMDPTAVYIELQDLGVDWGYGMMSVVSNAARYIASGYSIEVIKANGIEFGTLEDGVITFPVKDLIAYDADGGYYANNNGAFELVLPEAYATMAKARKAPAQKAVVPGRVKTAKVAVTK